MATTQITVPFIGGSEQGENIYGWMVEVEFGEWAAAQEPVEILVQPSREKPGETIVSIQYGTVGNRSSLNRVVEGYWRGGRLLSGSTLELFD